jgi:hypothetical protein
MKKFLDNSLKLGRKRALERLEVKKGGDHIPFQTFQHVK